MKTENVRFYDVRNARFWYNFGFVIESGLFSAAWFSAADGRKNRIEKGDPTCD
jgi:hypothetical protein